MHTKQWFINMCSSEDEQLGVQGKNVFCAKGLSFSLVMCICRQGSLDCMTLHMADWENGAYPF